MTNITLRSLDIPNIHKFGIGFESIFDDLLRATSQTSSNYPPYNIIKNDDDRYTIEVAVAGFKAGEVDVEVEKNQLIIQGRQLSEDPEPQYVHRGISARSFVRQFTLADHVEVKSATVQDGILTVCLERIIPEEQKPKKIAITYTK